MESISMHSQRGSGIVRRGSQAIIAIIAIQIAQLTFLARGTEAQNTTPQGNPPGRTADVLYGAVSAHGELPADALQFFKQTPLADDSIINSLLNRTATKALQQQDPANVMILAASGQVTIDGAPERPIEFGGDKFSVKKSAEIQVSGKTQIMIKGMGTLTVQGPGTVDITMQQGVTVRDCPFVTITDQFKVTTKHCGTVSARGQAVLNAEDCQQVNMEDGANVLATNCQKVSAGSGKLVAYQCKSVDDSELNKEFNAFVCNCGHVVGTGTTVTYNCHDVSLDGPTLTPGVFIAKACGSVYVEGHCVARIEDCSDVNLVTESTSTPLVVYAEHCDKVSAFSSLAPSVITVYVKNCGQIKRDTPDGGRVRIIKGFSDSEANEQLENASRTLPKTGGGTRVPPAGTGRQRTILDHRFAN